MPKQFRMLENGRTVLETCVETFDSVEAIDDIYLVSHPNYLSTVYQLVLSNGWQKVRAVLEGGEQRWESSWKAISHFKDAAPDTNILLHDCARPFVSERILTGFGDLRSRYGSRAGDGYAVSRQRWTVARHPAPYGLSSGTDPARLPSRSHSGGV